MDDEHFELCLPIRETKLKLTLGHSAPFSYRLKKWLAKKSPRLNVISFFFFSFLESRGDFGCWLHNKEMGMRRIVFA